MHKYAQETRDGRLRERERGPVLNARQLQGDSGPSTARQDVGHDAGMDGKELRKGFRTPNQALNN